MTMGASEAVPRRVRLRVHVVHQAGCAGLDVARALSASGSMARSEEFVFETAAAAVQWLTEGGSQNADAAVEGACLWAAR